ncbi:hypothetical protein FPJ27_18805 [Burkholderia sp. MS455]|uniref:hypothetical protein n=1 Tax=Burkholderia TaxID=32008 RepID=UPI000AA907C0|nr:MULTISPECIES: hypothetical protein [Burkholderia]QRR08242.1 hypothetical protein FPJ27_18805 [Burkholderia sp. MS455]
MEFFLREYIGPARLPALFFFLNGFRRRPALDSRRDRGHAPALAGIGIAIVTAGMALSLASRWRTGERPAIRRPNLAAHG